MVAETATAKGKEKEVEVESEDGVEEESISIHTPAVVDSL